jgi:hypothetical protein
MGNLSGFLFFLCRATIVCSVCLLLENTCGIFHNAAFVFPVLAENQECFLEADEGYRIYRSNPAHPVAKSVSTVKAEFNLTRF